MLPNLPHESTPIGADEDDNVEVRRVGQTQLSILNLKLIGIWVKI